MVESNATVTQDDIPTIIDQDDIPTIFKNFNLNKKDLDIISDEYNCWPSLFMDSIDNMRTFLSSKKVSRKGISAVLHLRHKVSHEDASISDIANSTVSVVEMHNCVNNANKIEHNSEQQSNQIKDDNLTRAIMPLVESQAKLATKSTTDATPSPYAPPAKQIITNAANLKLENINASDLMKNAHIHCDTMDNFLTFYKTLHYHFRPCNILINDLQSINQNNFSEPFGIKRDANRDIYSLLRNTIHSFLSKDGVFTNFKEGRDALSTAPDGYQVLNILLSQSHPKMLDVWACEKQKPLYSDYGSLEAYCKGVINCVELERSAGRIYHPIEVARMFLKNLDDCNLSAVSHALK